MRRTGPDSGTSCWRPSDGEGGRASGSSNRVQPLGTGDFVVVGWFEVTNFTKVEGSEVEVWRGGRTQHGRTGGELRACGGTAGGTEGAPESRELTVSESHTVHMDGVCVCGGVTRSWADEDKWPPCQHCKIMVAGCSRQGSEMGSKSLDDGIRVSASSRGTGLALGCQSSREGLQVVTRQESNPTRSPIGAHVQTERVQAAPAVNKLR